MKRLLASAVAVLMALPLAASAVPSRAVNRGFGGESPVAPGRAFLHEPGTFNNERPAGVAHARWQAQQPAIGIVPFVELHHLSGENMS